MVHTRIIIKKKKSFLNVDFFSPSFTCNYPPKCNNKLTHTSGEERGEGGGGS